MQLTITELKVLDFIIDSTRNIFLFSILSHQPKCKIETNVEEKFKDTKGVIRSNKSKEDRHHNGQNKRGKMTNNDIQNII